MKIRKTISVQTVLKERKKLQKLEQKTREEVRFQKFLKDTAKSILDTRPKYILKVYDSDTFVSNTCKNKSFCHSDSIWAPWSQLT